MVSDGPYFRIHSREKGIADATGKFGLAAVPAQAGLFNQLADLFTRGIMKALMLRTEVERISAPMRAFALAESIADVEYAIKSHTWLKSLFSGWLRVHIAIAFILYLLLTLHVWSGIHFGLRWFS